MRKQIEKLKKDGKNLPLVFCPNCNDNKIWLAVTALTPVSIITDGMITKISDADYTCDNCGKRT